MWPVAAFNVMQTKKFTLLICWVNEKALEMIITILNEWDGEGKKRRPMHENMQLFFRCTASVFLFSFSFFPCFMVIHFPFCAFRMKGKMHGLCAFQLNLSIVRLECILRYRDGIADHFWWRSVALNTNAFYTCPNIEQYIHL